MEAKITVDEFNTLVHRELPQTAELGMWATDIGWGTATLRLKVNDSMVRPGGTLSGPTMMLLADANMYAVVLSQIGAVALAVTTSFNINFLRRPPMEDIVAEGRMIKLGKRLAVLETTIFTADRDHEPLAHATGTYSIPP
ncbi:MAG: PaaI family thioesterase, partial [Rhodospirillales bacterium]|nr:PaaI family thioesterase [Rhodospirillales bacterium]